MRDKRRLHHPPNLHIHSVAQDFRARLSANDDYNFQNGRKSGRGKVYEHYTLAQVAEFKSRSASARCAP